MTALLLMVAGVALVASAVATWSIPAAMIVVGVALLAAGWDMTS